MDYHQSINYVGRKVLVFDVDTYKKTKQGEMDKNCNHYKITSILIIYHIVVLFHCKCILINYVTIYNLHVNKRVVINMVFCR
jgi:hypothetical protein